MSSDVFAMDSALAAAIYFIGGVEKVAELLDVSTLSVDGWLRDKKAPANYAKALAQASRVGRFRIERGDLAFGFEEIRIRKKEGLARWADVGHITVNPEPLERSNNPPASE